MYNIRYIKSLNHLLLSVKKIRVPTIPVFEADRKQMLKLEFTWSATCLDSPNYIIRLDLLTSYGITNQEGYYLTILICQSLHQKHDVLLRQHCIS